MSCKIKMQFDPEIAKNLGVEEAIMYSNLEFWMEHNKANKINFHEGRYWTFNSKEAFSSLFGFWTTKQVRRILEKLEKENYIITGNFNKHKYDKTKWYSCIFGEKIEKNDISKPSDQMVQSFGEKSPILRTISTASSDHIVQPIPNNKHNIINTNNKHNIFGASAPEHQEIILENNHQDNKEDLSKKYHKEIVEIMDILKIGNFAVGKMYGNKTQRQAIIDLLMVYNIETVKRGALKAIETKGKIYAPTIATPIQLRDKFSQLDDYCKKQNQQGGGMMIGTDFTKPNAMPKWEGGAKL